MTEAVSPPVSPPQYAASDGSASDTFFDVVPQTDQTSFQVGYLGLQGFRAWIKGDVLIKLDERVRGGALANGYDECRVVLSGVEKEGEQSIDLFSEEQILWRQEHRIRSAPGSSMAAASSSVDANRMPGTLPFSFSLTDDLPHCIHLPSSCLEYRLTATLSAGKQNAEHLPDLTRTTQVHLTRYTRPGELRDVLQSTASLQPFTWQIDTPIAMAVQLQRSLFRRAEPIRVFVRIPPPSAEKLLAFSLRSVEANLLRVITARNSDAKHELLLAHSGKLCRLHSSRAIVLRLQLHPPFDASNMPYPHPDHDAAQGGPIYGRGGGGGCESITQESLLHSVRFVVRIGVAIRADDGARRDVTLEREVAVLPGAAGDTDVRESLHEQRSAKGTEHVASDQSRSFASTSAAMGTTSSTDVHGAVIGDEEEEYDGYEDVGRSLTDTDDVALHHALEGDEPPPTLLESQNDLQVEVDVEGVGAGVLRGGVDGEYMRLTPPPPPSPPGQDEGLQSTVTSGEYVWQVIQSPSLSNVGPMERGFLPPPPPVTPPPALSDGVSLISAPHARPPPYVSFNERNNDEGPTEGSGHRSSSGTHGSTIRPDQPSGGTAPSQLLVVPEEANPPAYTHPPSPTYVLGHHPPSYEA